MNKLDTQFEQLMKGIPLDSPSKDFSIKVMERIQAEAAVQKTSILEDYQPVISRKVWILLIASFIALVVYVLVNGQKTTPVNDTGVMSIFQDSLQKVNTKGILTFWQSATGLFASIPSVAYLIILASMALWTVDLFLTRMKIKPSEFQLN